MRLKLSVLIIAISLFVGAYLFWKESSFEEFQSSVRIQVPKPEALMGAFKSFQAPAVITKALDEKQIPWETVSDSKLSRKDPRPEYSELTIKIPKFTDLEVTGSVELRFINRRLYKVVFSPTDTNHYLEQMSVKYKTNMLVVKRISPSEHVVIEVKAAPKSRILVQWEDQSLVKEMTDWIERFS